MKKIFVFMMILTLMQNTAFAATNVTVKACDIKNKENHTISGSFKKSGNIKKSEQNYNRNDKSIVECAVKLGEILGNK